MVRSALVPIAIFAVALHGDVQGAKAIHLQGLPEEVALSGAGTFFYFPGKSNKPQTQVFSYEDPDQVGCVQIDDQIYHLKFVRVKSVKSGKGRRGLGERKIEKWSDGTVSLTVDYTVTSLQEEGLGLAGKITIAINGQSRTYSVTGYWGS